MRRRPICPHGVNCNIGYAVAEVHCRAKRVSRIRGTSYRGNNPYKEWIVVQIKEEVRCTVTYQIRYTDGTLIRILMIIVQCILLVTTYQLQALNLTELFSFLRIILLAMKTEESCIAQQIRNSNKHKLRQTFAGIVI